MPAREDIRLGKYIVTGVVAFMTFSWLFNLYVAIVRDELSPWQGLNFVISLSLAIWLWRGATWARWITFAIYAFFAFWISAYALANASIYFAVCALTLWLLAAGLAMPSVGRFQRIQRQAI